MQSSIINRKYFSVHVLLNRLILGHQANGKHVILSGLKNWISDSFCVSQCLAQKKNSPSIDVIAVEVHTRYVVNIYPITFLTSTYIAMAPECSPNPPQTTYAKRVYKLL